MNNGNQLQMSQEDREYLERQGRLLDAKLITQQEYNANKAKIMAKYQPAARPTQSGNSFDSFGGAETNLGFGAPEQNYASNVDQNQAYSQVNENNNSTTNQMPMKWYKFLIYFALIVGPVLNVLSGFASIFASKAFLVGIVSIGLGILGIVTRQALATKKKNGPMLLLAMYAFSLVSSLLTAIVYSSFSLYIIVSIIATGVIIILNKIYFDKRKDIFVK